VLRSISRVADARRQRASGESSSASGYVFFCTLLAIGFGGCGQFVENQFKTKAVYDAPTSGFRIVIDASGSIPPGADITTQRRLEGSGDPT
jgi:hypothetical protein